MGANTQVNKLEKGCAHFVYQKIRKKTPSSTRWR